MDEPSISPPSASEPSTSSSLNNCLGEGGGSSQVPRHAAAGTVAVHRVHRRQRRFTDQYCSGKIHNAQVTLAEVKKKVEKLHQQFPSLHFGLVIASNDKKLLKLYGSRLAVSSLIASNFKYWFHHRRAQDKKVGERRMVSFDWVRRTSASDIDRMSWEELTQLFNELVSFVAFPESEVFVYNTSKKLTMDDGSKKSIKELCAAGTMEYMCKPPFEGWPDGIPFTDYSLLREDSPPIPLQDGSLVSVTQAIRGAIVGLLQHTREMRSSLLADHPCEPVTCKCASMTSLMRDGRHEIGTAFPTEPALTRQTACRRTTEVILTSQGAWDNHVEHIDASMLSYSGSGSSRLPQHDEGEVDVYGGEEMNGEDGGTERTEAERSQDCDVEGISRSQSDDAVDWTSVSERGLTSSALEVTQPRDLEMNMEEDSQQQQHVAFAEGAHLESGNVNTTSPTVQEISHTSDSSKGKDAFEISNKAFFYVMRKSRGECERVPTAEESDKIEALVCRLLAGEEIDVDKSAASARWGSGEKHRQVLKVISTGKASVGGRGRKRKTAVDDEEADGNKDDAAGGKKEVAGDKEDAVVASSSSSPADSSRTERSSSHLQSEITADTSCARTRAWRPAPVEKKLPYTVKGKRSVDIDPGLWQYFVGRAYMDVLGTPMGHPTAAQGRAIEAHISRQVKSYGAAAEKSQAQAANAK